MRKMLTSLKVWEIIFVAALLIYIVDTLFLSGAFYITIPLVFFTGTATCMIAVQEEAYIHAIIGVIGIFLPICYFLMKPW